MSAAIGVIPLLPPVTSQKSNPNSSEEPKIFILIFDYDE